MPVIKYRDTDGNVKKLPLAINMDDALSSSSENGVQNKVIKAALDDKSKVSVNSTGTSTSEVQYITVDGNEYKLGGGSGEPAAYLKSASTSGNTLTLVNKDNSTVTFTPTDTYQGTVKSVGAGTGLSISGTASTSPTVNVASGYKLPTTSEWGNKLDKNTAITGATKTKITYDSNGLVTAGADLAASDIPDLPASKITSGTFADARIASASTWNAKQDALTASNNITIDASNNISALKYYKQSEVTGIIGSGSKDSNYLSTKYDVTDTSITSYYDGLMITFVLPVAGYSGSGSVFQFNSLGYHPIVYGASSVVGTRYPVGGQITMVYNSVQTASAYLSVGSKSTITGCWQVCDYDATTKDATKVFDNYFRPYAGASAVYKYKLCALDKDNRIAPITITNQTDTTQVAKTPNSVGLKTGDLWFYTSSTAISASKALGGGALATTYYGDNMCAYNFNAAIPAYRMIYLRGTYNTTTGLFTLYNDGSSPCTSYYTVVPNNTANITLSSYFVSGYYYWLVGSSYSTADYLQVFGTNPLYYFDGTNLIPYQEHLIAGKQDVSTLEADVAAKGFTKNTGTVTSVQVQAGTGLASSQSSAQTGTLNTTISVASGYKLPTTSEWSGKQDTLTAGTGIDITSNTISKKSRLAGLKMNCLGDSITYGSQGGGVIMDHPWPEVVGDLLGLDTVRNYGISSSTIAAGDQGYQPMVTRYSSMDDDANIICVFGGTNDWSADVPLGTYGTTDTTTFYGALYVLISGLCAKYPRANIVVFTPLWRYDKAAQNNLNDLGLSLRDYGNAIQEIAGTYSIPVLDLLYNGEFHVNNAAFRAIYTLNDNKVHPNQLFVTEKLAPQIAEFLETGYSSASAPARATKVTLDRQLPFGYTNKTETALITNKTLTFTQQTLNFGTMPGMNNWLKFTVYSTADNPFSDESWAGTAEQINNGHFKVTWDGTDYYLTGGDDARALQREGAAYIDFDLRALLGNGRLLNVDAYSGDSTIPFLLCCGRWGQSTLHNRKLRIISNDIEGESVTHTISISQITYEKTNIPDTLLPGMTRTTEIPLIHAGSGAESTIIGTQVADASGRHSVAAGMGVKVSGEYSFAAGVGTVAAGGRGSFAEGFASVATGNYAHAEGSNTLASGCGSHAQGLGSVASGSRSSAAGYYTKAEAESQFVVGYGNATDNSSIFIVGNGLDSDGNPATGGSSYAPGNLPVTRQNAFRVTQSGTAIAQTGLQINNTSVNEAELTAIKGYGTSKEDVANKTTTLSSSSTDTQYPSAKVVYDGLTTANWNLIKTTQSLPISFEYGYAIRTGAYDVGQVVDLTPETNANMAYSIIDCVPEVSFLLNLTGGWTPRAWAFLDTDNKLLKVSGTNAVCGNLVLQAPAAATKFVVNATIGTIGDCYINWLQGDLDHLDTKTLVYIRGVGYSTTSNITGEGQYYVHTSERTLKKVVSYANGAVALDMTMPFSIHTLYYYNGALYKYSGSNNFDGLIRISSDACRPQTLDSYVYQIKNVIDTVGESNFYNKVLTLTEANGYNSWPIISYCGNELVCCYSRGTQHVDSTSGTYYKTSPNGIVWSTEKTLLDTPAARENATGKGFDANGNTLFWIRINSTFSLYKYSSGTWSVVCSGVTVGSFGHIGDIMNADGTLVCFWCDYNYTDGQKYGVARSTDNGVTWTFTELAVSSTIDLPTETQGVYLGNGRLLAIGRKDNDGGTYANMQLQSTDYGATWTKAYTNITDVQRSTTSMIYDSATDTVYAYYCNRSNGQFLCRQATVSTVWDNPTNWPASTLIATGSYPDGGNANVVEKDGKHYLSYYSSEDTERTMICTYVRTVSADNLLAHVESFDSSTATLNLT